MKNLEIREEIKKADVKYWEVADKLGINDGNFSRKLRKEIEGKEKEKVLNAIKQVLKERTK